MMFFVGGITGKVGGAAARRLLSEGHTIHTIARDPQKAAEWSGKGVDVRQGDWNDSAALAAALEGVDGAFVMVPPNVTPAPGYPESKSIIASVREALGKTTPPRVVRTRTAHRLREDERPRPHHDDPPAGRGAG